MTRDSDLAAAFAYSRFATQALAAHPADREWLDTALQAPLARDALDAVVAAPVAAADGPALAVALRTLRRRTLLHTLARDLTGRADLAEVCNAMTALAETSLRAAVAVHHPALAAMHGEPRDESG